MERGMRAGERYDGGTLLHERPRLSCASMRACVAVCRSSIFLAWRPSFLCGGVRRRVGHAVRFTVSRSERR